MSKRPTTATGVLSLLRRPVGRLRDLPIWSKLGLILIVPTIATIIVGANGVIGHIETYNNADRARTLAQLSRDIGQLVHHLQDERARATLVLGTPASDPSAEAVLEAYRRQLTATDAAQRDYALRRGGLVDLPPSLESLLRSLDGQLSDLPALRNKVATREGVSLTYTAFLYRVVVANLLSVRDFSAQLVGDTGLSERMRASTAVSTMKEALAQERAVVLRVLSDRSLPPARVRELIETLAGQEQALQMFVLAATPSERDVLDLKLAGADLRLAKKYEGQVESAMNSGGAIDRRVSLGFTAEEWNTAQGDRGNLLREVELELDNQLVVQATALRDAVVRQILGESGVLVGMLLLAILFAWLIARSMARSLRALRHGALAVAQYGLPQAVARLRDPALATQMSPTQVATQIAEPLPIRSRDEFGQVTEAFNAVHLEAVRTAAEQAALRASVATMFVNLARRSQILVDRLIGHLDRLERGEEDPDRLGELFQLDHLATRMRRNDENLLVLAGADSTRVQRTPAALLDVLRAAQSEVEHYTRVEFGVVDRDIEVAAHAVNDVVHLVAELLDNATAFSPPDSSVLVEARRVADRAVMLIEDRGIGVSPEQLAELNERLAAPPTVDVTVSRMMGLVVVARLAGRHGIKVELRPGRERGTIADVTLPTSVLVPQALAGRPGAGRELPAIRQAGGPPQPPGFGAPLALESAPSGGPAYPREPAFGGLDPRPGDMGGDRNLLGATNGSTSPRTMPAWSDLTGAGGGANGTEASTQGMDAAGGVEPLPQRRPGESRLVQGHPAGERTPLIPRQLSGTPDGWANGSEPGGINTSMSVPPVVSAPPVSGPPMSVPPIVSAPPVSAPPMPMSAPPPGPPATAPPGSAPAESAPPVWPPIGSNVDEGAPPPVPGALAAALDMTAEIPKLREETVDARAAAGPSLAPAPPDPRTARFADETMELPIFRELESAWFRAKRSGSRAAPGTGPATPGSETAAGPAPDGADQEMATGGTTGSTSMISMPTGPGHTGAATTPADEPVAARLSTAPWQTAADDGWRAAGAAADVDVTQTTEAGLPKRVPMAQLVPGGVDRNESSVQRRTPDAVRGLLSAYHRGVQRGRTQPKDSNTPEPTPAGPQTSQAGKEQEA